MKLLFVCSRNRWRSPTAERLFAKREGLSVRSAGTSKKAARRVSEADLHWADQVLVMEKRHKTMLQECFGRAAVIHAHVLHVEDIYQADDPELIAELDAAVGRMLDGLTS